VAKFDAQVILAFADDLYRQANSLPATYAALGAFVGLAFGAGAGAAIGLGGLIGALLAAVVLGAIAFSVGKQKAFALKLQAQVALCQVQIEANTRGSVAAVPERVV
jgi:hypothetical protein